MWNNTTRTQRFNHLMLYLSNEEWLVRIGKDVRLMRILKNMSRGSVCEKAGISETALKRLEDGKGCALKTLLPVLLVLGKEDWLKNLRPEISINPLRTNRIRAGKQKSV